MPVPLAYYILNGISISVWIHIQTVFLPVVILLWIVI